MFRFCFAMALLSFGAVAHASPSLRQGREEDAASASEDEVDVPCNGNEGPQYSFALDIKLTPQGGHKLKGCGTRKKKALQDDLNEFLLDYGVGEQGRGDETAFLAEVCDTSLSDRPAPRRPKSEGRATPSTSTGKSNGIPLPCCGWANGGCMNPNNSFCQGNEDQCTGACNGQWHTDDRRHLAASVFRYYGGGFCRYCLWDNLDHRRLWKGDPYWFDNVFKPELQNLVRNEFTATVAPNHWACLGNGPRVDVDVSEIDEAPNTECAH